MASSHLSESGVSERGLKASTSRSADGERAADDVAPRGCALDGRCWLGAVKESVIFCFCTVALCGRVGRTRAAGKGAAALAAASFLAVVDGAKRCRSMWSTGADMGLASTEGLPLAAAAPAPCDSLPCRGTATRQPTLLVRCMPLTDLYQPHQRLGCVPQGCEAQADVPKRIMECASRSTQ